MLAFFVLLLIAAIIVITIETIRQRRNPAVQEPYLGLNPDPRVTKQATAVLTVSRVNEPAITLPNIPDISGPISIRSHELRGVSYTVDLSEYHCTCADWQTRRSDLAARDCRRACKHIIDALISSGHLSLLDVYSRVYLLQLPGGVPVDVQLIRTNAQGQTALIAFRKGHPWIDIVTATKRAQIRDPIQGFGYNAVEERWAYGKAPKNARLLHEIVQQVGAARIAASVS